MLLISHHTGQWGWGVEGGRGKIVVEMEVIHIIIYSTTGRAANMY